MLSTYSSTQHELKESMDDVILKKKENKKKWNDASRQVVLILEKHRQIEYYKQNRNVIRERQKKNYESNQEVKSLRHKILFQQNASTISLKRKGR